MIGMHNPGPAYQRYPAMSVKCFVSHSLFAPAGTSVLHGSSGASSALLGTVQQRLQQTWAMTCWALQLAARLAQQYQEGRVVKVGYSNDVSIAAATAQRPACMLKMFRLACFCSVCKAPEGCTSPTSALSCALITHRTSHRCARAHCKGLPW
jgi:hypothetical protein